MNGGAIKAILMGLESNTSKMPNPALVMRNACCAAVRSFSQSLQTQV